MMDSGSILLAPFSLPSLKFSPRRYRAQGVGDWSGHIPFACDLICSLHPSVFVELGTHLGESYFAFCQAIAENSIETKAYAVDTWRGDVHTGSYGEEVFREVDAYNREHYSRFSRLLRMLFDEAAARFNSESIDLLHIDGIHTYEAVRHDFDLWWPKMKPGGIVLLHDSCVRTYDFGVWRLIEELHESLSVAEFFHSNGLAVVRKPASSAADGILPLLFDSSEALLSQLRRYYEICAGNLEHEFWSARQKRPAEWDVTTQLFWRAANEDYSEPASVRATHTVNASLSRIVLTVPPLRAAPIELRIDLTDRVAFLKLHTLSVVNARGDLLSSIRAAENAPEFSNGGLHAVTDSKGAGLLVLDAPRGASFVAPIAASTLASLQSGGQVTIEMSGVDPTSFACEAASAREQENAYLRARLAAIENSKIWRALRPFVQLQD